MVFFIFCIKFSFGQANISGTALYVVKPVIENSSEGNNDIAKALEPFSDDIAKNFVFRLDFNKNLSQFTIEETEDLKQFSERSIKLTSIQYGYADTIWQQNNQALNKTYEGFGQKSPVLMKQALDQPAWKISNEKKQIDGFTCYKATKTLVIKRGKKTFTTPMIAWFCPDIPVSFGPIEFGGLPGLILEAQTNKFLYGLKQIKLNNKIKINSVPSYPVFTEQELIKRLSNKVN